MKQAGIMLSEIPFGNFPVIFANGGLQFFIIDYEHGGFDYAAMANLITVARLRGITAIVRLPNNARKDIVKLADMGADGFLLPMTNCAEDIRAVVRYAKYRPVGERGISTMRAHTLYDPPEITEYKKSANVRMKVYAQIETRAGAEHLSEIMGTDGVDGCFVGPNDLSDDLGCLGGKTASAVLEVIRKAGACAAAAGKTAGIITGNADYLAEAGRCGFQMFSVGSELNAAAQYCKAVSEQIKNL